MLVYGSHSDQMYSFHIVDRVLGKSIIFLKIKFDTSHGCQMVTSHGLFLLATPSIEFKVTKIHNGHVIIPCPRSL